MLKCTQEDENILWHWGWWKQQKIQLSANQVARISKFLIAWAVSSSALDVLFGTVSRVAQTIGSHFVYPKVKAKSQQDSEGIAFQWDGCCQSHYQLQLSFMEDSCSWQLRGWNSVGTSSWEMLPSSMPLMMLSLLVLGPILALLHSTTYLPLLSSASVSLLAYCILDFLFRRHLRFLKSIILIYFTHPSN